MGWFSRKNSAAEMAEDVVRKEARHKAEEEYRQHRLDDIKNEEHEKVKQHYEYQKSGGFWGAAARSTNKFLDSNKRSFPGRVHKGTSITAANKSMDYLFGKPSKKATKVKLDYPRFF